MTVGCALYEALFAGEVGLLLHQSLSRIGSTEPARGLRLRLRFNPRDPDLDSLQSAPWELLYRNKTEDFLALSRLTPVVRAFDIPRAVTLPPVELPLRVLLIPSQDPAGVALSLSEELAQLTSCLRRNPSIEVEVLDSPDSRALRATLGRKPFHVLHFMGHATFDRQTGEGALFFANPRGGREVISGRHLATKVKDFPSLRLVVLNACDTARASSAAELGPFSGVAAALVMGGVHGVVAMQSPIEDSHAVAWSATFYDRIAQGKPVDEAMTEGRQAIHSLSPTGSAWAIPVLFLRTPSGDLFAGDRSPVREAAGQDRRALRRSWISAGLIALASVSTVGGWMALHPAENPPTNIPVRRLQSPDTPSPPTAGPESRRPFTSIPATKAPVHTGSEVRKVKIGDLQIEISATPALSQSLGAALGKAARGSTLGDSAGIVRLDIANPRLESFSDSGLSFESCSLSATLRWAGHGQLDPVRSAGSAVESVAACTAAAEKLAVAIVQTLSQVKEESR